MTQKQYTPSTSTGSGWDSGKNVTPDPNITLRMTVADTVKDADRDCEESSTHSNIVSMMGSLT